MSLDRILGERAPRLAGLIDLHRPQRWVRWGPPFNGQSGRRELMAGIAASLGFDAFVETGIFRGMTTRFVRSTMALEVFGAEINPRFYAFCRWRFLRDSGVHLHFGDSRRMLRQLAADPKLSRARLLFYLDAHWNDDLPLAEEVAVVATSWREWVIVIDDFEVPGDPGYGFDDYGPGKALRLADVPLDQPGRALFFPALPSEGETGMRRGCVVIGPTGPVAEALKDLSVLRPHNA